MSDTVTGGYNDLVRKAANMRRFSYAPYSDFSVGAAVLIDDGTVYGGCNIENASFSAGICAERVAISKAVSEGYNTFKAIAIVGGPVGQTRCDFCYPCGICRQFLNEFCDEDFVVVVAKLNEFGEPSEYKLFTLDELLPHSFGPDSL